MSAPEDVLPTAPPAPRRPIPLARICLWSLPFLFFAALSGLIPLLEAPLRLLLGWAAHLWASLPVLLPQWRALLLPLACLAISLWIGHGLIRWAISAKGGTSIWKLSQTSAIFGLLLLGSAAAIAMSGVVHEIAWLSKEPVIQSNGKLPVRTQALMRLRDLANALRDFKETNGRYPDSLDELSAFMPGIEKSFSMDLGSGRAPEPVIYLKPGEGSQGKVAMLFSPPLPPDSRVVVAYADGEVKAIGLEKWAELLQAARSDGN